MFTFALQIGRVTIHLLHSEMEHLDWQTSGSFELGVEYITMKYNSQSCVVVGSALDRP